MTTADRKLHALLDEAQRALRAGRPAEAVEVYRKILRNRPNIVEIQSDLGVLLAQLGRLVEAVAPLEKAIALKPDFFAAHTNLGFVLKDLGKLDQAVASFGAALALRPDLPEMHYNLGDVLLKQGRLDEAAARFEQALALRPDLAEAHLGLGIVLSLQEHPDRAAARFEHALALRPAYAEAHNNLGAILLKQKKLDEAQSHLEQALALHPHYAEALNNLGSLFGQRGQLEEAAAQFEQALAVRPDYVEALNNLGNTFDRLGKFDQALPHIQHALALQPDYVEAHNSLGNVLMSLGKFDEAVARFHQSLALKPDGGEAHVGLAGCYLTRGDYERGWPAYEGRLHMPGLEMPTSLPRWRGEPLAGRRLLLYTEQGLGDTFHFLRYARLLKGQGARVVLAAPAALGSLLKSHPDLDELFLLGSAAELPRCDFYLPLHSAPLAFRTDAQAIPHEVPYLWADPALTARWRQELAAIEGFKIGIAWQGSRDYYADRSRSIPLAEFGPLARVPGVRLISLQKGFGSQQLAAVDFPVVDLSGRLDDETGPFMDTAAVISNLDLVVVPNTAIAHLAGALGAPVWLAPQFLPDWRWLHGREDTPWYPTMRLFRQTTFGDWSEVFERMAAAAERVSQRVVPASDETLQ